jgi:hypothetical protein
MIRAAVACTALSAMSLGYRSVAVMFAVLGMSFALAYLLHRDKLRDG